MIALDARADGTRVKLKLGETFTLRLEENPSTGYRWRLEADGAPALELDGDQYEAPPRATVGGPGHHQWRFRAVAAGSAAVQLSYRRSFGARARAFTVAVEVH